ncbi:hypothetical protein K438DRAFT_1996283 [Mycena galopus ATCC 62051]|nr:hypothetical protein K438DRAFT_1996283 [Mycena galopus ATCC 62051]
MDQLRQPGMRHGAAQGRLGQTEPFPTPLRLIVELREAAVNSTRHISRKGHLSYWNSTKRLRQASEPLPSSIQARAASSVREQDGSRSYTVCHRMSHHDVERSGAESIQPEKMKKAGNGKQDGEMGRGGGFPTREQWGKDRLSPEHCSKIQLKTGACRIHPTVQ